MAWVYQKTWAFSTLVSFSDGRHMQMFLISFITKTLLESKKYYFIFWSEPQQLKKPHVVITQPDGTLFFLIFTYLRGRSHWNSRDYASNVAICHFLKPETNKGDFRLYFELVEKSCRGRHHSEISKTNTKTLIYSIWIRPQGSLGCQKMRQDPLYMPVEVWCAKIAPKKAQTLKIVKIEKKCQKNLVFLEYFEYLSIWGQY